MTCLKNLHDEALSPACCCFPILNLTMNTLTYCSIYSFFAIKKWHRPLNFLSYKKFLRSSNDYVFLRFIFFCWVFIRLLVRAWQSNVIEVENYLKYLIGKLVLLAAK